MNIAKEKRAIEYLKAFQPQTEPYYLCYSGGKDSDTILTLAKLAGVNYEAIHNLTTVDAPETVQFIKAQPEIKIDKPEKTMWQLIVEKRMPPTRLVRYCCKELKERGGNGRIKVLGVRWDESRNRQENADFIKVVGKPKTIQKEADEADLDYRINKQQGLVLNDDNDKNRRFVEHCYRTTSTMINPIVDWTDKDVLEFLCYYGVKINPLYEAEKVCDCYRLCGEQRVGCVCCPMSGGKGMKRDLVKYPKFRDNYLRAFDKMIKKNEADGLTRHEQYYDAYTCMMWWVGDSPYQQTFETPEYLKGAVQL